ncbi:MAG: FG-GAP repeat domain-containing protein, partial [Nitrososphaeraceae archaeon]
FGTTLDGAYVMDLEICDIEPGTAAKKCPVDTDLEGVLVTNKNQCDIFEECAANSPLGESLGTLVPVKVADVQLCQLSVPEIEICQSGVFEGFAVNNQAVCNTILEGVEACGPVTDLPGMLTNDLATCDRFTTCEAGTPLGMALGDQPVKVADSTLCNLDVPEVELFQCMGGPMEGAIVTDQMLCEAPNDDNKCADDTDLPGVYAMDTTTDCKIYETCPQDSLQAGIHVSDLALCNVTNGIVCGIGTANEGAIVTDEILCGNIAATQIITVNKTTDCDPNRVGQQTCDNIPDAKIMALGNNTNPSIFLESQTPINVTLQEGFYSIMEKDFVTGFEKCLPPFEAGRNLPQFGSDLFMCSKLSEDCMGTAIGGDNNLLCNIENVIINVGQDIVTANVFSDEISVFLGDGTGSFGTSTEFTVGGLDPGPASVAVGHFNADTNLDIVTANFNTDEISVFLGDGTGNFGTSTEFTVGGLDPEPASVAVGHFNADTNLDIVTANAVSNEISVFLGDGTGSFGTSTEFTVGGLGPTPFSVAVGNFN